MILQLCRTGHDNVSHTRMTTLAFILFPLDDFRCNFVSTPELEYPLLYHHDTSQLWRTSLDNVSHTRMTTPAFILSELSPLDDFRCNFVSTPELEYPLLYHHDTSQLWRTSLDNVSHTRMTTLAFILSELSPLDDFRCNFVSTPELEYPLLYHHDTSQLWRTSLDNVSHTRMTTLAFILSELSPLDGFRCNFRS